MSWDVQVPFLSEMSFEMFRCLVCRRLVFFRLAGPFRTRCPGCPTVSIAFWSKFSPVDFNRDVIKDLANLPSVGRGTTTSTWLILTRLCKHRSWMTTILHWMVGRTLDLSTYGCIPSLVMSVLASTKIWFHHRPACSQSRCQSFLLPIPISHTGLCRWNFK
jgi:hypothetical protein